MWLFYWLLYTLSGKTSSGKNIRHLNKISSLFPDAVFPDKVATSPDGDEEF